MQFWKTKSGYRIIQILSGRSNVFLLTNGAQSILVDTSTKNMWHKLECRLNKLNVHNIDFLILTHSHHDHAANACAIKMKYHSQVIIHKSESVNLSTGMDMIPNGTNLFTRLIVKTFAKRVVKRFNYEPCEYDFLVDAFFDLHQFGYNAYLMHTPGHTMGSISVIIDDEVAIVGDAMFGVFKGSIFPPYANDVELLVKSWGKLLETGCSVFIPAHGSANSRILVQKNYLMRMK